MLKEEVKALEILVRGRVQRVGYRRYLLDIAQELGVAGYVVNMNDGSVKIFCQGEPKILEEFIEKARSPPPPATVKQFDVKEAKPRRQLRIFKIRYGSVQEELQEGFGAMQSIFMDYWSEFRDYRQEFRDFREEFRDYRKEFRDYREEFRDFRQEFRSYVDEFRDYRQEFRDFRQEFRSYVDEFRDFAHRTDENFKLVMNKYGEISEKLTIILETLVKESKETREMLNETMRLLREALEKLSK